MNETITGKIIEAGANDEGVPVVIIEVTEQQLACLRLSPLYRPAVVTIKHDDVTDEDRATHQKFLATRGRSK